MDWENHQSLALIPSQERKSVSILFNLGHRQLTQTGNRLLGVFSGIDLFFWRFKSMTLLVM